MVTSVDGATALPDGRSGGIGSAQDKEVFRAVRAAADVVLVGAGTARAEDYGPVPRNEAVRARRTALGLPDRTPRLAVVSRTLDLPVSSRLFTGGHRPVVVTGAGSDPAARAALAARAEVVVAGTEAGDADLVAALGTLRADGADVVVCEGGPRLNGVLIELGVVDEVCATVAPSLLGGASGRMAVGADHRRTDLRLDSLLLAAGQGELFARWIRTDAGADADRPS